MGEQHRRPEKATARRMLPFLLALLLTACNSGSSGGTTPNGTPPPTPVTPTTISGDNTDKIADVFLQLVATSGAQGTDAARQYAAEQELVTRRDEVRVTLLLDSTDPTIVAATALAAGQLGARVTQTLDDRIELVLPLQALLAPAQRTNRPSLFHTLADFAHVRSIRRTPIAQPTATATPTPARSANAGTTDAIVPLGADVWHGAGITGKGVKVGIIDASYTEYQRFLKPTVIVKSFRSDDLIEDPEDSQGIHGTACAEVVSEIAPDAQLYLAAAQTPGEVVQAIRWLTDTAGVTVMSASIAFYGEFPTDDTSPMSREVDRAKEKGVFYAAAAGNEASGAIGSENYEGHFASTFKDSDHDGWHDFVGLTHKNGITMRGFGVKAEAVLDWDDWKQPHVNYDLYLYDSTGKEVARSTQDQSKGRHDPLEWAFAPLDRGKDYTIKIKKVNPSDPDLPFDLWFFFGAQLEQVTPAGSLTPPSDARGAVAVAAIDVETDILAPYSAQGPTKDGRKKPDIGAPTNVLNQVYGTLENYRFSGTSAATPHLAGVTALYKQAFPQSTPDATFRYFAAHAKQPKGSKRGDNLTGVGRVFLDTVPTGAQTTPAPTPPIASVTPAGTVIGTAITVRPTRTSTAARQPTRTATATPSPTITRPTSTPASPAAFTDDFSSTASGLPAGGYQNGVYVVAADTGALAILSYPRTFGAASSETYEVQARRTSGPEDAVMGLVIRRQDTNNLVIFAITSAGEYGVYQKIDGSLEQIGEAGRSAAIARDGTNTLRVTVSGGTFTFTVNGQQLAQGEIGDLPWDGGGFGFVATGGQTSGAQIAFDNYRVTLG